MPGWAIFIAYAVVGLLAGRKAVRAFREHDDLYDPSDALDRFMSAMIGLLCAVVWPLGLIMLAMMWRQPKTSRELKLEKLALEHRIADLEREAGIK